ncbi:MAG: gliding motility lipoprotein GldH [Bacteroidota bacterium]
MEKKFKTRYSPFLLWVLGFLLLSACDSARVYEDYSDLGDAYWHLDSLQRFTFQVEDTSRSYNLFATFRNGSSYPYYNLYFQYSLKDSSDRILAEELKETLFFDAKSGAPLGSGLGDLFDHQVLLLEGYRFSSSGAHTLTLQQSMRMDTLPFLLSVGSRLEYANQEK